MAIPQNFIQDLIARADVVEVVGRYVQLKKAGANYQGLCPFHSEKSPSFTVSPSKQFFHCFGCGKNGNAIGFLMEHSGMGFIEAVEQLASQMGMQVPHEKSANLNPERDKQLKDHRENLHAAIEKAASAYQKQLKTSDTAIQYCKQRGLTGQIAKRFQLGYAPEGWHFLAGVFPQYDDVLLVDSGLVISSEGEQGTEKRYDRFRHRLMFPIRNAQGKYIGFGGRVFGDEKPKYLNSPETDIFNKGRELYGLFEARQAIREKGYALITEGYMDVVALAQWGFPNAVATLGTACTADHVHKILRFTDRLIFSFDGDAAGRRAAAKALETSLTYAADGRNIQFLFLPAEHDPDSYIRAYGPECFEEQVRNATPLSQFLFSTLEQQCQLDTAEGRAQLLKLAKPLWQQLPDGGLKIQLTMELAHKAQVPLDQLNKLWSDAATISSTPTTQTRVSPTAEPRVDTDSAALTSRPANTTVRPKRQRRGRLDTRADLAVRLVFLHSELWLQLTHEDHSLLCELPAPYGELFVWLDQHVNDHGSLAYSALLEQLAGHPGEDLLRSLITNHATTDSTQDCYKDLRDVLNRMLLDHLKEYMSELALVMAADPGAQKNYRDCLQRSKELGQALLSSTV